METTITLTKEEIVSLYGLTLTCIKSSEDFIKSLVRAAIILKLTKCKTCDEDPNTCEEIGTLLDEMELATKHLEIYKEIINKLNVNAVEIGITQEELNKYVI